MASKPFASGHILAAADVNDLTGVYDRATATIDVVSSTTETTIYTKSIGAGHMSTDRMLRLTILGDYFNNTGLGQDPRLKVSFGGTVIWDWTFPIAGQPDNANRRPFYAVINIANKASASVQFMTGIMGIGSANVTVGIGSEDKAAGVIASAGTFAINTASAQTLLVTAQHDTSSANLSLRRLYAMLELL